MNKRKSGTRKRCLIAFAALAVLGGCAVVPYDSGYGYYGQPAYVEPAVYVAPVVSFGFYGGGGGGYYGHRHHGYGRGYGHHRR